MIANYYQRTFTVIQSNFVCFLHYKGIIQQKNKKLLFWIKIIIRWIIIMYVENGWLSLDPIYPALLHSHKFSDNFSDMDGFQDGRNIVAQCVLSYHLIKVPCIIFNVMPVFFICQMAWRELKILWCCLHLFLVRVWGLNPWIPSHGQVIRTIWPVLNVNCPTYSQSNASK